MSLKKPLIVVKHQQELPLDVMEKLKVAMIPLANNLGCEVLILPDDFKATIHDNSLHESINNMDQRITELVESNDRLTKALIEAYSESEDEEVPRTYMDGSEVK